MEVLEFDKCSSSGWRANVGALWEVSNCAAWRLPGVIGAEALDAAYPEFIALEPLTAAASPGGYEVPSVPAVVPAVLREWLVGAPTDPSV
jgi:hypothetical protein